MLLTTNRKQHRWFNITNTREAPGGTWRRGEHKNFVVGVLLEWQRATLAALVRNPQPSTTTVLTPKTLFKPFFENPLSSWYTLEGESMPHSSPPFWPIASGVVVHHVFPRVRAVMNFHNIRSTNTYTEGSMVRVIWRSFTRYNRAELSS